MKYLDPKNSEIVHLIALLVEQLIPEDRDLGLPGVNSVEFFEYLERNGELEKFLSQMTELIRSIELKNISDLTQISMNDFVRNKDFKKGLTKYLGVALVDYYYLIPEVRALYSQNVPAPFPMGNRIQTLDLTLLESVYFREKVYREAQNVNDLE